MAFAQTRPYTECMRRSDLSNIHCSLGRSLDVVDPWSLLILRDVYLGVDTFDELVRDLEVSRAVLSDRLDGLVQGGVLQPVQYSERPARYRYVLSEAGKELVPVVVSLVLWGDKWRSPDGPPIVFDHTCGQPLDVDPVCAHCRETVTADDLTARPGPGGRYAAGTRVIAERLHAAEEDTRISA